MKRERSLLRNMVILGIGTIIPKIASLITLPIITYFLTKEQFGQYDLIITLVSLILPVATLQLQSAAFRFLIKLKKKNEKSEVISNIVVFTTISSIIALLIVSFFLNKFDIKLKIVILLYYFFDIIVATFRQISRGLSQNLKYSFSVLISSVIELLSILVFVVLLKTNVYGAVLSLLMGCLISSIYLYVRIKLYSYIHLNNISIKKTRELIGYSWPLIPNSLSSWVMQLSDRLIIINYIGLASNAIYAVANKIPNLFSIVQSTFTLAWQENACLTVDNPDSSKYYSNTFSVLFNVLVGGLALIIAFNPLLFFLLIKGDYNQSYNHILILFMGAFFSSISSYIGGIYIAHKKSLQIGISTTVAALINLAINFLFIRKYGIYAASVSTLISYFVLAVYRLYDIQKIQKINYNIRYMFFMILILIVMCVVCFYRMLILDIINVIFAFILNIIINRKTFLTIYKKILKKERSSSEV